MAYHFKQKKVVYNFCNLLIPNLLDHCNARNFSSMRDFNLVISLIIFLDFAPFLISRGSLKTIIHWSCNFYNHGIIIQTGIASKKIPSLCATQLAGGILLKKLKYYEVLFNIFEFPRVWEIVESWLVYENKISWIIQSYVFFLLFRLFMGSLACKMLLL